MGLRTKSVLVVAAISLVALGSVPANAASSFCCPATGTTEPSDALRALRRAVGATKKCSPARCDCNGSGSVTATDAMEILAASVGSRTRGCPSVTTTTLGGTCGDGVVDAGEDCEPPSSFCRGGCNPYTRLCVDLMCSDTCSCPAPACGDSIIDAGESCDPPGSPCATGTCNSRCGCSRR